MTDHLEGLGLSRPKVIIIAGPTASGKSSYAENLAQKIGGEIVNADSVQMYTRLAVGTAKPDWKKSEIPHHLFDICESPRDFDVSQYRSRVIQSVDDILKRSATPILVGGSLFYIKSLFYPPHASQELKTSRSDVFKDLSNNELWCRLKSVDLERAQQLHENDRYRVQRALLLWEQHGVKPSTLKPKYQPLFGAQLLFLSPPLEVLYERINARTLVMIDDMGWVDEAREVYADTMWRDFVSMKKFIGYPELFTWIANGEKPEELPAVVAQIQQETRRYAKRQRTFWKSLCAQLSDQNDDSVVVKEISWPYVGENS